MLCLNDYYLSRIKQAIKLVTEIKEGRYDNDKELLKLALNGFIQNTHTQKYDGLNRDDLNE